MFDESKKKQIEQYIQKLQALLTKVIAESKEMQELRKLLHADESEMQLCIFSIMMDKDSAESIHEMDMETFQKMIMEAHSKNFKHHRRPREELDTSWTDDDKSFLRSIKIII